jgi:DNA topoisomerase-3
MSRDAFEEVLGAMARAGLVQHLDAVFEKDGKQVPYRNVRLTREGYSADENTPINFIIKELAPTSPQRRRSKKALAASERTRKRTRKSQRRPRAVEDTAVRTKVQNPRIEGLEEALRTWRLTEARRRGIPAFRIFTDQALRAIVSKRPETERELLAIPGIGMTTVKQYGPQIYRVIHGSNV